MAFWASPGRVGGPRTGWDRGVGGTAAGGVEPGRRQADPADVKQTRQTSSRPDRRRANPKYAKNGIANRRLFRPRAAGGGPSSPGTGNRDDRAIRANDRGPLPFGG